MITYKAASTIRRKAHWLFVKFNRLGSNFSRVRHFPSTSTASKEKIKDTRSPDKTIRRRRPAGNHVTNIAVSICDMNVDTPKETINKLANSRRPVARELRMT